MAQATPETLGPWVPADTFGARLAIIRQALGWNQTEAALRCGLKAPTWATWEGGSSPRNMAGVVEKIHAATGVDRTWLMWGGPLAATTLWIAPVIHGQLQMIDEENQPMYGESPNLRAAC